MTPLSILAVNVGSSSLRLDLWDVPGTRPRVVLRADGLGSPNGTISVDDRTYEPAAFPNHPAALDALLARLPQPLRLDGVGHRPVSYTHLTLPTICSV